MTDAKKAGDKKSGNNNPDKKSSSAKSDFVRSLPPDLPVDEVVRRGRSLGIQPYDVYSTRRYDKSKKATPEAVMKNAGGSGKEAQLQRLVIEVGLDKSEEVFKRVRKLLGAG